MLAASGIVAVGAIPAFLTGALAVQIRRDIDLPPTALGLLIGLFFGCSAIASAPAGRAVERIGGRRGMLVSSAGAALCLAGIALLARDPTSLAGCLVVGGLANGVANPAANLLLVEAAPKHRRALVLGVKQAAIPTATLLAGLAVPVLALTIGWRWAFAAAAVLALLLALESGLSAPARLAAPGRPARQRTPAAGIAAASRLDLLLLAIGATLGIWLGQSMGAFLVSYAVDQGIGEGSAGFVLTTASVAGIAARIVAGWVVDRRRGNGVTELVTLLLVGIGGVVLLATGGVGLIWVGAIAAFAGGWGWSGVLTFVVVRANPEAPAAATGVTQGGVFVGATVGVPLFGVLVEATSYQAAWTATAVSTAVAAAIMAFVGYRLRARSAR